MGSQIYPNLLGGNVYAPMRNLTQTPFLTGTEIGGIEGQKVVGRGAMKAAASLRSKHGTKVQLGKTLPEVRHSMEAELRALGLAPGEHFGKGDVAHEAALRSTKYLGRGVRFVDSWNKWMMALYSKSDVVNRYITLYTAKELAKDALAGKGYALDYVKRLNAGDKASIYKLMKSGNQDDLGVLMARQLIAKTQFNYGKESLSEFGREFGRAVSMFTKWPLMVMGDLEELQRNGRALDGIKKYVAPMLALGAADIALNEMEFFENPAAKLAFGRGLFAAAPGGALLGVSTPPLVQAPLDLIDAADSMIKGDVGRGAQKLVKTASPFMPFGVTVTKDGPSTIALDRFNKAFEE
jgi:hypothetical protein